MHNFLRRNVWDYFFGAVMICALVPQLAKSSQIAKTVPSTLTITALTTNVTTNADSAIAPSTNITTSTYNISTNTLSLVDTYFSLDSGSYLLNPYTIVNSNQLSHTGSSAVFYIRAGFDFVTAWNIERRNRFVTDCLNSNDFINNRVYEYLLGGLFSGSHGLNPFDYLDFSGNITYFAQGSSSTPSASTIVGSGEFSADATIGFPNYIGLFIDTGSPHDAKGNPASENSKTNYYNATVLWFGEIFSYGATTDEADSAVHSRLFTGLGARAAFPSPWENLPEPTISVQMGCAWIDSTHYVDSTTSTIVTENGQPKYFWEPGFAIESDFRVPISSSAAIDLGASVYTDHQPDTWNAHIGITFPLSKLTSLF